MYPVEYAYTEGRVFTYLRHDVLWRVHLLAQHPVLQGRKKGERSVAGYWFPFEQEHNGKDVNCARREKKVRCKEPNSDKEKLKPNKPRRKQCSEDKVRTILLSFLRINKKIK